MSDSKILVEMKGVKQHFTVKKSRGQKATLYAVDGVDLTIEQGETFGLVGESGCGKSTLGKTLLRLYPLTAGQILFDGQDISTLKGKELTQFRCKAQMIFQDPSSCLNPRRKIRDILLEPYRIHKLYSPEEREKKVLELCDMVGLSHIYLDRYPHEMSGGQKQRVGIARALALHPKLIVCDEPVSALDVSIQAQVINLLQDLQEKLDLTYLFISHNLSVVEHCCRRIGVMYLGHIVELAPAGEIYRSALHPYTQALLSAVPTIGEASREKVTLTGDLPSPVSPPSGCPFHTRCPYADETCRSQRPALSEVSPGHWAACHRVRGHS
ncbi:MAG TPA: ATP-binding cassette domain-containing protein [Candidatus Flavonifractor intestinipullorum]|uniref:ATP-binding cassette domain-containing protein n=1 Tax=Candidatus Flavonifractor intestinipullorum TaxID=2838587 RepID=A0A9D2S6Y5_9FIRM|nr:ATP-binding cassette domain-containing protein [Candidatus Flavonifractor intestinipullorum]